MKKIYFYNIYKQMMRRFFFKEKGEIVNLIYIKKNNIVLNINTKIQEK